MSISTFAIQKWIGDTLVADPVLAGKVHNGIVGGADYPAVVFESVNNLAVSVVGGAVVMNDARYLVKAVGEGRSMAQLEEMANAVYARLHLATGSNAAGEVWACVLEEELDLPPDVVDGRVYRTLGQRFRIIAKGA